MRNKQRAIIVVCAGLVCSIVAGTAVAASGVSVDCPATDCGLNSSYVTSHSGSSATVAMDGWSGALRFIVHHGTITVADQRFDAFTTVSTTASVTLACPGTVPVKTLRARGAGAQCFASTSFSGFAFCGNWLDSDSWVGNVEWCP